MEKHFNLKHGDTHKHYLYMLWINIKKRCYNKKSTRYESWGGRGIRMYKYWISDYLMFKNDVLSELGERPDNHSLDRIDNDGNYEPGNLRWATRSQQKINSRKRTDNKSGYTGVSLRKDNNKWASFICVNNKMIHLGLFDNKKSACIARNKYIANNNLPHKIQKIR